MTRAELVRTMPMEELLGWLALAEMDIETRDGIGDQTPQEMLNRLDA